MAVSRRATSPLTTSLARKAVAQQPLPVKYMSQIGVRYCACAGISLVHLFRHALSKAAFPPGLSQVAAGRARWEAPPVASPHPDILAAKRRAKFFLGHERRPRSIQDGFPTGWVSAAGVCSRHACGFSARSTGFCCELTLNFCLQTGAATLPASRPPLRR